MDIYESAGVRITVTVSCRTQEAPAKLLEQLLLEQARKLP